MIGRPDLKVAAVSSAERLEGEFADAPTFAELGVQGLDDEIMWRGFMTKKGIPAEAQAFYNDLFTKVNADPEWQEYVQRGGATPLFIEEAEYVKTIKINQQEFAEALKQIGAIK